MAVRNLIIKGFEHYSISDDGRVFNPKGHQLRFNDNKGYKRVHLHSKDGYGYFSVHRLVALTYVPKPRQGKPLVLHRDGDKTNNHFSNLYWGTYLDNSADRIRHGNHLHAPRGVSHYKSKLIEKQVRVIKWALHNGVSNKFLAKAFKISEACVSRIKNGISYTNIKIPV